MKYEMIFGDEALFDGAPEECFCVAKNVYDDNVFYKSENLSLFWLDGGKWKPLAFMSCTPLAMRSIIKEPKHWTLEDKKAGRLPEAGVKVTLNLSDEVIKSSAIQSWENGDELEVLRTFKKDEPKGKSASALFNLRTKTCGLVLTKYLSPIETPEERAKREREEWCSKALDSAGILSEMKRYELKRLGEYIGSIHDALQSGELPMPNKESE